MIKDLMNVNQFQMNVEVKDWREALTEAGRYLVESGKIEQGYVDNTIKAVEEMGPYIVIMPGVAFGHSRPDMTVHETCLHMIRLKKGIDFGSVNDPVKFVVMFASKNDSEHIEVLQEVAGMLMEPDNVKILLESNNIDEIKALLKKY